MSKNKYPSIFSHQMEASVFIILQIFFTTCTVLKIGEYMYHLNIPRFSWGIFSHMTRLDQLHVIENISWIISVYNIRSKTDS